MLASNPVPDKVRVADAIATVAVVAVPLALTVISVWPAAFVVMPMNVAPLPVPTVVDSPGVRVKVAEPAVIVPPIGSVAWAACTGVALTSLAGLGPGVTCVSCAGVSV